MAEEKKTAGRPLGVAGEAVQKNIRRIRDSQGVSGAELSARMTGLKRPIPPLGIQRIEAGTRRVDVDDLLAFAVALGVSPVALLMPEFDEPEDRVTVGGANVSARMLWRWLVADRTIRGLTGSQLDFLTRSWPKWELDRLEREFADVQRRAIREQLTDPLGAAEADRLFEDDDGDD